MVPEQRRELISEALDSLQEWFGCHKTVETAFGRQKTENGYTISEIRVSDHWVSITVYVRDRSVKKKDVERGGDLAYFSYDIKNKKMKEIK